MWGIQGYTLHGQYILSCLRKCSESVHETYRVDHDVPSLYGAV